MKNAWLMAALAMAGAGCTTTVTTTGCVSDADCLVDELCDVDGFCVVDDTYQSCVDTSDCLDTRDACYGVDIPSASTSGNFCTNECGADADCQGANGFGGVCYAIEADATFLCYQQCDFDSDCYAGSVCIMVDVGGGVSDLICVPRN